MDVDIPPLEPVLVGEVAGDTEGPARHGWSRMRIAGCAALPRRGFGTRAALLTRMCTQPKRSAVRANVSDTAALSETSQLGQALAGPVLRSLPRRPPACPPGYRTRRCPHLPRPSPPAMVLPSPWATPVTTPTSPCSFISISSRPWPALVNPRSRKTLPRRGTSMFLSWPPDGLCAAISSTSIGTPMLQEWIPTTVPA